MAPHLSRTGAERVIAIDYQLELVRLVDPRTMRMVGSALELPLDARAVDSVVVMDVLHHLPQRSVDPAIGEVFRVLRPGGALSVFEPANTVFRRALTGALMSPLGSLSGFTRAKREMVRSESATLVPWLEVETGFVERVCGAGFTCEAAYRGFLGAAYRLRRQARMHVDG